MNKIKHTANFEIDQPAEKVFPLFSAEGEKLWVPGWDYENVMGSTELHEDYIFLTENHDHGSTKAIWLVKKYQPENYHVQFYKIEPGDKLGVITVSCRKADEATTEIEISYEYFGLSKNGDDFIENFTSDKYQEFIMEWKDLLIKYFG